MVLLLAAASLPAALIGGGAGAATLYAAFLTAPAWLHTTLLIPDRIARDISLGCLAVHVALQVAAAFATRRLLVRIGLDRAALAGALFFALAPPFVPGAASEADVGATVALLLLATERCAAPRFAGERGVLALAAMVFALGTCGNPPLEEGGALALLWSLGRLATSPPRGRARPVLRLLAGAALGLLVAVPFAAVVETTGRAFGLTDVEADAQGLGIWLGWLHSQPAWDLRPLAAAGAPVLPLLATAMLGCAHRRGWPIRAALGVTALLAIGVMTRHAQVAGENAGPVMFLAIAVLAAIAIRDAEQRRPAARPLRVGVAMVMSAAAAAIVLLLPGREMRFLALGEGACALLALAVAERPAIVTAVVLLGVVVGYEVPLIASVFP